MIEKVSSKPFLVQSPEFRTTPVSYLDRTFESTLSSCILPKFALCTTISSLFKKVFYLVRSCFYSCISCCYRKPPAKALFTPPVTLDPTDPFGALLITPGERGIIQNLLTTIGSSNLLSLAGQKGELEAQGKQVEHVHPLKFLWCVFSDPSLVPHMESIRENGLKWDPFINGLTEKLQTVSDTLEPCKSGFAKSLRVNLADIEPFFAEKRWADLVVFLIDVKMGRRVSEPKEAVDAQPPSYLIDDLPLSAENAGILRDLFKDYATSTRAWIFKNRFIGGKLQINWHRLDQVHPLKLLSHMKSERELMGYLHQIFQLTGTKSDFMSNFSALLEIRDAPEITPYVADFAAKTGLVETNVHRFVANRNWSGLVEHLYLHHRTHSPN
ncbi:MAG: hypothetical protein JSS61_07100 [Verrucomicrobia bacterium]|nr:hypothetical protein [Verrucomicrobiota bacterium]